MSDVYRVERAQGYVYHIERALTAVTSAYAVATCPIAAGWVVAELLALALHELRAAPVPDHACMYTFHALDAVLSAMAEYSAAHQSKPPPGSWDALGDRIEELTAEHLRWEAASSC